MIKKFLNKNELVKHTFTLVQGTAAAQLITILMQPVLRRMFTPEEFGLMALYMSSIGILSVIASGRYDMAIVLPKEDKDALGIFKLATFIALLFSLALLAVIFLISTEIVEVITQYELVKPDSELNMEWVTWSLFLVPVGVFILALYNALNFLLTRKKKYIALSAGRVIQTTGTNSAQFGIGLASSGFSGLIFGQLIGQLATVLYMFFIKQRNFRERPSSAKQKLGEYSDFPSKSVPSGLINILALQLPNYFIVGFFGLGIGGIYDVVNKVLNVPLTMVGKSISQVFFQKISEDLQNGVNIGSYVRKFTLRLFLLMLIPMAVIFFFGEPIFGFVFGKEYELAGILAGYFSLYYLVRFVYFSQSTLFSAQRRIGLELRQNIFFLISQLTALFVGYYHFHDFKLTFIFLAISGFVCYSIFIFQLLRTASKPN